MVKAVCFGLVGVTFMAGAAFAGVDVNVNVGTPRPVVVERPVVEREKVVVREERRERPVVEKVVVKEERKDRGKHKGWEKKEKKHHKEKEWKKRD